MKPLHITTISAAIAAAAIWASPILAQHDHGGGHGDHAHGAVTKAKTFGEATRRIADSVAKVKSSLDGGALAGVSEEANALAELAKQLGALALAADSGIAREKVKDANLAGKKLAEAADELHEIADKGDLAASKAQLAKVVAAASDLEAFAPATYFCPMHCEGDKTYDRPGECPVCHMKLKKQTTEQFSVDVVPRGGRIEAGKPVDLAFTLKDPRGMQVKDVEVVHEMPLHLLMVSNDLSWFAHEHPLLGADGTFSLTWTFPTGGEYTLFHDFTPRDVGMQVVPVKVRVEGTPAAAVALVPDAERPKTVDGYTVTLDTGGALTAGGESHLAYTITRDGAPVTNLAPYLGAMGHLVIIGEDLTEFVHSHPHEGGEHAASAIANQKCPIMKREVNPEAPTRSWKGRTIGFCCPGCEKKWDAKSDSDKDAFVASLGAAPATPAGGPRVDFEAHFRKPGIYKGWAQFNVGTASAPRVLTAPFTFKVASGGEGGHGGHGGHGAAGHADRNVAVNAVCPLTGDKVNEFHTRDFKGQTVAFCDGDCALRWDGLTEEARMSKLVAAIAGTTAKSPHGAQVGGSEVGGGHDGQDDDSMPEGMSLAESRRLYLTPGGAYTDADIKANGTTTAYEKFKGQMAKHDMKPKSGDLLCPITMTKANPKFTWVIGGQTYQFCCPPCIDEYVLLAKEHPDQIKSPADFLKK